MSDPSNIADWITAGSTAATAIVAAAGSLVACLAYRRDSRASFPVVEVDLDWSRWFSNILTLNLIVRNQLYETITLDSIRVKKPSQMTFSKSVKKDDGSSEIEKGHSSRVTIGRTIAPIGIATEFPPGRMTRLDMDREEYYLSPPDGWNGGIVDIDLRISSRALTMRDKRIVIKRRISPNTSRQIDENASKND